MNTLVEFKSWPKIQRPKDDRVKKGLQNLKEYNKLKKEMRLV